MKYDKFMNAIFTAMLGFCVWFLKDLNTNVNALKQEVGRSNTWIEVFRDAIKRHDDSITEINRRIDVIETKRVKANAK